MKSQVYRQGKSSHIQRKRVLRFKILKLGKEEKKGRREARSGGPWIYARSMQTIKQCKPQPLAKRSKHSKQANEGKTITRLGIVAKEWHVIIDRVIKEKNLKE